MQQCTEEQGFTFFRWASEGVEYGMRPRCFVSRTDKLLLVFGLRFEGGGPSNFQSIIQLDWPNESS